MRSKFFLSLFIGFVLSTIGAQQAWPSIKKTNKTQKNRLRRNAQKPTTRKIIKSPYAKRKTIKASIGQLSKDLRTSPYHLNKQAKKLAQVLNHGSRLKRDCRGRRAKKRGYSKLCRIVWDYKNKKGRVNKSYSRSSRRYRAPRLTYSRIHALQKKPYLAVLKSVHRKKAKTILGWTKKMLRTKSCPRNLSAAAIRSLEALLPSRKARRSIEKLYKHAYQCLRPYQEGYQVTHFRQALLRKLWGQRKGALSSINKAIQTKKPFEHARLLYWAGFFQNNKAKQEQYWTKLQDEYPLSYHSLEIWRFQKRDPLEEFASKATIRPSRYAKNRKLEQAIRWLETLYLSKQKTAGNKFANWIASAYSNKLSDQNFLYISKLKEKHSNHLSTISFLSTEIRNDPKKMNQQTLELLFPMPYLNVFEKASPKTDTFLVLSIARQESAFNPRARSRANARGLLQLLPSTAKQLSGKRRNNLYHPEINARLGSKFISKLINRFSSVELALAAYNAGPSRVVTWKKRYPTRHALLMLDLIPFKETRNYVSSILRNNYWYSRIYSQDNRRKIALKNIRRQQKSQLVARLVRATR